MITRVLLMMAILASSWTGINAQTGKKILIAYYSLHNGNTRIIAEQIRNNVGGDLFRIETVQSYPAEYRAVTEQAKKEIDSDFRPKLRTTIKDIDKYDIIYIGSPNWWGTITPAVFTFLESYNFSGKIIIPFITHEGSRMGNSIADIKRLAPKSTILEGLPIHGNNVDKAESDVRAWLRKIGQLK